jgi:hypothetical protein
MPLEVSTAENVSNLTWLVFAAASLLLWRYRLLPHLGSGARRSLCALLCVLLLMFPIISISDDLHPDMVAAVEGESKSRLLKLVDASPHLGTPGSHAAVIVAASVASLVAPAAKVLDRLLPVPLRISSRLTLSCRLFRGPPHWLLS